MTATRLDITIEQGADYGDNFPLNYDPTGYSASMQIKLAPGFPYALLTLTTANGGLVIDGADRMVTPVIPASVTAAILAGKYAYDLKMVSPSGITSRAFEGSAYVSAEVTDVDAITPPATASILLEDGTYMLREDGGTFLTETQPGTGGSLLLELGGYLLNELGGNLLLEE